MHSIEAFEEIDAPPGAVWEVLLAFDHYGEWNPFIRRIEGIPASGETLRIEIDPPNSRGMTVKPEIVAFEEHRRLAWHGRLFVPFAFDGYHEFHLEPIDDGTRTRLLQRETFRGALVPLLLDEDSITAGFEAMNRAMKERTESQANLAE